MRMLGILLVNGSTKMMEAAESKEALKALLINSASQAILEGTILPDSTIELAAMPLQTLNITNEVGNRVKLLNQMAGIIREHGREVEGNGRVLQGAERLSAGEAGESGGGAEKSAE